MSSLHLRRSFAGIRGMAFVGMTVCRAASFSGSSSGNSSLLSRAEWACLAFFCLKSAVASSFVLELTLQLQNQIPTIQASQPSLHAKLGTKTDTCLEGPVHFHPYLLQLCDPSVFTMTHTADLCHNINVQKGRK